MRESAIDRKTPHGLLGDPATGFAWTTCLLVVTVARGPERGSGVVR